jgi:hypothetical protein
VHQCACVCASSLAYHVEDEHEWNSLRPIRRATVDINNPTVTRGEESLAAKRSAAWNEYEDFHLQECEKDDAIHSGLAKTMTIPSKYFHIHSI